VVRQRTKKTAAGDAATGDGAAAEAVNTDATAEAASTVKPNRPNVKLAATAEPLGAGELTVGMNVIGELPDAENQAAGWHCAFAGKLVQLFPDRFKLIVEKGN
jgi:hypothetical protein